MMTTNSSRHRLSLVLPRRDVSSETEVEIEDLIVAGWAGRNAAVVVQHMRELELLGIARPCEVPAFYRISASLLTTAQSVQVVGMDSTGEVECVVLKSEDQLWVGVGSDHTDRRIEGIDITLSKQACPKPIAKAFWAFSEVESHWDQLILRSYVRSHGERRLYQEGTLAELRVPAELIQLYSQRANGRFGDGALMFCGTLPVRGEIGWADEFSIELIDPVMVRHISHSYSTQTLPVSG